MSVPDHRMAALLADVEGGNIKRGDNVLFWHTGGATALFAEPEILGSILENRGI